MGIVYRGRHLKLKRPVAIKMLLAGGFAGPLEHERFKREAEAIAALCHPNIVQVFDAGECDGHPYFVMELLERGSLAQQLDGSPRSSRDAAATISILARAVHAAHAGGIMHRDLKPGNILVALDGTLKVADFGLARRSDYSGQSTAITITGTHLGTPSYMAPEQAAGAATEFCPLIDIYALGAILYEMLTGRPPFRGETPAETERQVLSDEPVPPTRLNPTVPRDLQTICLKCLQKDPARRYASAADLADDVERFSRGDPILARPVGIAERALKWCRRRPSTTLAIAVSVVAMAGALAGGIWLQQVEHARDIQEAVRRESARASIESALPSLSQFVESKQWLDAVDVLRTAQSRLEDAQSSDFALRLAAAEKELEVAQELERIRQSFLSPEFSGFVSYPSREAYARVFRRVAIGREVGVATAAERVRGSALRQQLLIALDNAAYIEAISGDNDEARRLLAVARAVEPDPWQDRFRDPAIRQDSSSLQELVKDATGARPAPPSHQMILIGMLLSGLDANTAAITVLREAQLRDPSDFSVNLWLSRSLTLENNHDDAIQFLRAATALNPTDGVTWTELGRAFMRADKYEDAIGALRKAISVDPGFKAARANLVLALVRCQRCDEAIATERDAASAIPSFSLGNHQDELQLCRARAALEKRDWSVASAAYTPALDSRNAHLWFEFAAVTVLAGDTRAYSSILASMLDRQESLGLRRFLVARACTLAAASGQEVARAAKLGMQELDQYADHHWSLTQRAALLCRDGRPREAIPILERSLESSSEPKHRIVTWAWLARAHLSLGEQVTAKTWLAKAAVWLDQSDTRPEGIHVHDWLEAQILRREVEHDFRR